MPDGLGTIGPCESLRYRLHREHLERKKRFLAAALRPAKPACPPPVQQVQQQPKSLADRPPSVERLTVLRARYGVETKFILEPIQFTGTALPVTMLEMLAKYFDQRQRGGMHFAHNRRPKERITVSSLRGDSRLIDLVRMRQIACVALHDICTHLSTVAIARFMGGRDHSTIIHAIRRAKILRQRNVQFDRTIVEAVCICRQAKSVFLTRVDQQQQ